MSNLLVVDWDYFFPNPLEGGFNLTDKDLYLYDWGHREAPFFIDMIWSSRAASFMMHDLPLPQVTPDWETFPERFKLADDATVYYADSNMHSGLIESPEGGYFDNVLLFDAHHDAGYSVATFDEWQKKHIKSGQIEFSCEDWMLVHYLQGAKLHWRFPDWHENFKERLAAGSGDDDVAHGPFWPKGVTLDAEVDDGFEVDMEFDTVFICRSGAWVPPWEDGKFMQFVESWGVSYLEQMDDQDLVRKFDVRDTTREVEAMRKLQETVGMK